MFGKGGPTFRELMEQAWSGTARGYDLIAPKFEVTPFCTPPEVIERAVSDLGKVRDALDVCCGTGVSFEPLRDIVTDRIVGIDFSEGMLAVARQKISPLHRSLGAPPGQGPPRIEVEQRDVLTMDYRDRFDLITCFGAFGHIRREDEPAFIGSIRKALRPGGRFVFVTSDEPSFLSRQKLIGEAFNAVMRVRNVVKKPPFIMYYLTFMLPDVERHLKWYGFDVVVTRDIFDAPFKPLVRVIATKR